MGRRDGDSALGPVVEGPALGEPIRRIDERPGRGSGQHILAFAHQAAQDGVGQSSEPGEVRFGPGKRNRQVDRGMIGNVEVEDLGRADGQQP
jgi:hypothetical protein